MGDGREAMLAAVAAALRDVPGDEPAVAPDGAHARAGGRDAAQRAQLFAQRCGEYRATVVRCGADAAEIRAAVKAACARHGAGELAVAPGVTDAWCPAEVGIRRDEPPLDVTSLDRCDGALTGCGAAIALTGTIVLDGSPQSGRRALTLVPDLHICVVLASDVVETVPEAIARAAGAVAEHGAPITLVSGPSATSDIELQRVEGVHGPRRLEVVLAG